MAREGWESAAWIRARAGFLAAVMSLGFAAVLGRAVHLQVVEKDKLRSLARDQYLRTIELASRRGEIHDRSGGTLASSVEVDSIYVDPELLGDDPRAVRAALARVLRAAEVSPARRARIEERALRPGNRFTWVRRRASPALSAAVRALDIPGLGFVKEPRRFYPQRELAAHVLGLTGADGEGLEGLERSLDGELRGKASTVAGIRDARGNSVMEEEVGSVDGRTGATVALTLDTGLQYLAQKALDRAVRETRATSATAVVLDPSTGELLALAVSPGFNPNVIPALDQRAAVRDRAITDAFEPGSLLKVMLVAGALEKGLITRGTQLDCENGAWRVGRHVINDHRPYRMLTPPDVLRTSSNVCAGKIGLLLGAEELAETYRAFGIGERTGVELPGETAGILAPMRSDLSVITASFGQGPVTASALQLAAAFGVVANGGKLLQPHVVREVRAPDGTLARSVQTEMVRQVISAKTAREVLDWMEKVVSAEGTAERASIDGYRVAGKTGTAQKPDPAGGGYGAGRVASFAGIVPAGDPRLVVLVVIDEPKTEVYGGLVAAPVFREIAAGALKVLGIAPTLALAGTSPPPEPPREVLVARAAEGVVEEVAPAPGGVRVPDLRGLFARAAVRTLSTASFEVDLSGSGRVVQQRPAAGAVVPPGSRVSLMLEPL